MMTQYIRDVIIGLVVAVLCYFGNSTINNGNESIRLRGDVEALKQVYVSEHSETVRRFEEFDKKFDLMNADLNRKLDSLNNKMDRFLEKRTP